MCTICAMTQSFVPERHESGEQAFDGMGPLFATISETGDAASGISTSYSMAVGDSFAGSISTGGDVDWIAITFEAGQTYEIDALGNDSGGGSLRDTDLRLYDSNGTLIEYDDFDGAGWDASISYTATSSGTYYIAVSSYFASNTGSYSLEVGAAVEPYVPGTEASIEQLAQYLREGSSGTERTFNTSSSNEITVNLSGLTAAGQQLARWAMETWEMVADIDFVEVSSGEMITADDEDSGAFAYFPNSGSTSAGVELNVSTGWLSSSGTKLDTYSFQTYIHEFGHAIGLNHQGAYNYTGSPITYENDADFTNDSWQLSVMSYFSQSENTATNASFAYVTTAQMADIMAVQDLYGAAGAGSVTDGNTTYGRGSNLGNYLDEIFAAWETGQSNANIGGNRVAVTLYDAGGIDTIDLGYLASNEAANIDLNGGAFSNIGNDIGTLGIAVGTVIENLETGAGNDTITGNAAANSITSGNGADTVDAAAGNDSVWGGNGQDTLLGGTGNDNLYGGDANDSLYGGTQGDRLEGGAGDDTIEGGDGRDTAILGDGNDVFIDNTQTGRHGSDRVFGEDGDDTITGGGGNDSLHGQDGYDMIWGGGENDSITGGIGFDTIYAGTGNDTVVGGNGRDVVYLGDGDDVFEDSTQNDTWGRDRVDGGAGNDTFILDGGYDTVTGGAGADTFIFTSSHIGNDRVTDYEAGVDALQLDDALWGGGRSVAQVISDFADDSTGTVIFDFGNDNVITLQGVNTLAGLDTDISIF